MAVAVPPNIITELAAVEGVAPPKTETFVVGVVVAPNTELAVGAVAASPNEEDAEDNATPPKGDVVMAGVASALASNPELEPPKGEGASVEAATPNTETAPASGLEAPKTEPVML